jgi:hypothetical protein
MLWYGGVGLRKPGCKCKEEGTSDGVLRSDRGFGAAHGRWHMTYRGDEKAAKATTKHPRMVPESYSIEAERLSTAGKPRNREIRRKNRAEGAWRKHQNLQSRSRRVLCRSIPCPARRFASPPGMSCRCQDTGEISRTRAHQPGFFASRDRNKCANSRRTGQQSIHHCQWL